MSSLATTQSYFDEVPPPGFTARPGLSKARGTVLYAEDDEDLRLVMEYSLTAMGYVVVACANAELAMAAFRARPLVDLLVTDLEMPGMSGLQLARELTSCRTSLPVLLITGSILNIDNIKELVTQGWAYMSKPCDMKELAGTLHRLANRNARIDSFGEL